MIDQLHEKHFHRLALLIEEHTGIRLPPSKRSMVEGRLRRRLRALDLSRLDDYGKAIFEQGKLESEFTHLVDCVTTNKTDFFREPEHFDYLQRMALRSLLVKRNTANAPLKLWSAAASIGAEAYSIAMVAADMLGIDDRSFLVLGTDICTDVLYQARRAVYPEAMAGSVPQQLRRNFMMKSLNNEKQEVRIVPEIRRLVRFEQLNLMDEAYPVDKEIDVIFCRNVLIYFSKENQSAVVSKLCGHLRPGGFLFLGHSEPLAGCDKISMCQVAPAVFQRGG